MWVEAIFNVIGEIISEVSVWGLFPNYLKKLLLDIDIEHHRLVNIRAYQKSNT